MLENFFRISKFLTLLLLYTDQINLPADSASTYFIFERLMEHSKDFKNRYTLYKISGNFIPFHSIIRNLRNLIRNFVVAVPRRGDTSGTRVSPLLIRGKSGVRKLGFFLLKNWGSIIDNESRIMNSSHDDMCEE